MEGRVAALLELGAGFNPEFSGRENVFLNGEIMGLSRKETERVFPELKLSRRSASSSTGRSKNTRAVCTCGLRLRLRSMSSRTS